MVRNRSGKQQSGTKRVGEENRPFTTRIKLSPRISGRDSNFFLGRYRRKKKKKRNQE